MLVRRPLWLERLGLDYVLSSKPRPLNQTIATSKQMTASSKINHPLVASFGYRPYYLNPTDQQTIQFTNFSIALEM